MEIYVKISFISIFSPFFLVFKHDVTRCINFKSDSEITHAVPHWCVFRVRVPTLSQRTVKSGAWAEPQNLNIMQIYALQFVEYVYSPRAEVKAIQYNTITR